MTAPIAVSGVRRWVTCMPNGMRRRCYDAIDGTRYWFGSQLEHPDGRITDITSGTCSLVAEPPRSARRPRA